MVQMASISITNRCNMRCKMCDIGQKEKSHGISDNWFGSREMSPEEWHKIISKLNPDVIHVVGVEPLLYKSFDELLKKIKTKHNTIMLTTNALLFNKWKESIVKYCDNICISIDGLKDTHDKIRGVKGSFKKCINAIKYLKKHKKYVRTSFAITPDNYLEMHEVYFMLKRMKVNKITINHYNYIHANSCYGYDCKASNNYYDLKDIDIKNLYRRILKCSSAVFLPNLMEEDELRKYYHEVPVIPISMRCVVLEQLLNRQKCVIDSDGRFCPPARCWLGSKMGYAGNGIEKMTKSPWIKKAIEEIEKNGMPPPCQRLCCAGRTV